MAGLSELDDETLMREYRWAFKHLTSLDPELPKPIRDIRASYWDYIGEELAARGLITSTTNRPPGREYWAAVKSSSATEIRG
jgi:hypothetical protein